MICHFCGFDRGFCVTEQESTQCQFKDRKDAVVGILPRHHPECLRTHCGWEEKFVVCMWDSCARSKESAADRTQSYLEEIARKFKMKKPENTIYPHEKWNKLVSDTVAEILKLGELKGGEYAGDSDRLANFRRNGKNLGLPMETIWAVYAGKHWDAIMQYIRDEREGITRKRLEPISGRVDDLIVYSLLLKAMLDEKEDSNGSA